jgi:glutamate/tyrosine decarboxylase-like PLP-dependent enzyme
MIGRIRELERTAKLLDPSPEQRARFTRRAIEYAESFLEELDEAPVYIPPEAGDSGLYDSPISEDPVDMDTAVDLLSRYVDRPGLNPASPRYLAYIPGGGLYPSAIGDFLAAVTNRYAGVFFAAPGAVRMENMLLEWMAKTVGYPEGTRGNLTSGGSAAHLEAIVTAREAYGLKAKDFDKAVVYMTDQRHHSADKALRIAGLGECVKRTIPMDKCYRMDAEALDRAIVTDREAGLNPWLVIANAGTTDTGAVDPLESISQIAEAHGVWMHVDGAYGAFFALCEEGKRALAGMEKSDSIIMDPHKGLFLPYGTGAVLVKDAQKLYEAHRADATYMQDLIDNLEEPSPADLSLELTKHFRGPRLWLPLKLFGTRLFAAALEEKLLLARYFHDKLGEVDGFELGPPPDLSVVTFRCKSPRGDTNALNREFIRMLQEDGQVYLSSTMIDGKFTIRLVALSFRTHLDDIERTLEVLLHMRERLRNGEIK